MKPLSRWIIVAAIAVAASCFSGKRGPRGTNVGTGSDHAGPWSQGEGGGESAALVEKP